jgi:hypothetical protein
VLPQPPTEEGQLQRLLNVDTALKLRIFATLLNRLDLHISLNKLRAQNDKNNKAKPVIRYWLKRYLIILSTNH